MPRCSTHNVSDIIVGRFTAIFDDFVTNTNRQNREDWPSDQRRASVQLQF